jgi:hypothetical protein
MKIGGLSDLAVIPYGVKGRGTKQGKGECLVRCFIRTKGQEKF